MTSLRLHEYQELGVQHILDNQNAALFIGMGGGKTVATLTAIDALYQGCEINRVLVIAPKRVAESVWPQEIAKWPHLRHLTCKSLVGRRHEHDSDEVIHTINFDVLNTKSVRRGGETQDVMGFVDMMISSGEWPYDMVVVDESSKLKNATSKRVRALRRSRKHVHRWVNLTGTPAPNGLHDLWSQMWFLDGGQRLGKTLTAFRNRWFSQDFTTRKYVPTAVADREIHQRIQDLCLSIDLADYIDIEQPVHNKIKVPLPAAVRGQYEEMEEEFYVRLDLDEVEAANAAVKSGKLRQIAAGAMYLDEERKQWKELHRAKLDALDEVIEEAAGMPVMVAYQFKFDLARLRKAYPKGATLDDAPDIEERWNAGKIPVLFIHPASAGHGLNLQHGSNIIVLFNQTWNLEEYEQVIERIGPVRQAQSGYKRPVFVHHLIAENTVEEDMLYRLRTKASVQDTLKRAMQRRR